MTPEEKRLLEAGRADRAALVPGAINSSVLSQQQNINLPKQEALPNYSALNSAIPMQSIDDIVSATNQQTGADQKQGDLYNEIAKITGESRSLAEQQNQQYQNAGLAELAKTKRSLQTQLMGLNDQATQLQLDYNYTIPNTMQEESVGRGRTAGGLQPLTAGELRKNQIAQGALAARALPLKAAYYAASDDYATAKEAADLAAQAAFDADERKLKVKQAQLDALAPTLKREDEARRDLRQAKINEQQQQIKYAREDFTTGQGLAITAMKLNPSDPQAQYAAQQALKLDPKDPQYLQKIMGLVGQYQSDPNETAQAIADLNYKRAQTKALGDKGAGGGDGDQLYSGLTSATATAVRSKVSKFSSEPIVQNFATIQEGFNFAKSIPTETKNPADDQALIYALAKALDPGSVVREGEYKTAQIYAQSWVQSFGKGVTQAINGTGFLSKTARENIKKTIENKYQASKKSYDNVYGQYTKGVNSLTGRKDGANFLVDYATPSAAVTNSGFDEAAALRAGYTQEEIDEYLMSK